MNKGRTKEGKKKGKKARANNDIFRPQLQLLLMFVFMINVSIPRP